MKYTNRQKQALAKLYLDTRSQIKGKNRKQISKIWERYRKKKTTKINRFTKNKPLKASRKVDLKTGFYKTYHLKPYEVFEFNRSLVQNKVKKILQSDTTEKIRYIHIVVSYLNPDLKDVTLSRREKIDQTFVISDVFSRLDAEDLIKNNFFIVDTMIGKSKANQNKSDFEINTVNKIIIKVIFNP